MQNFLILLSYDKRNKIARKYQIKNLSIRNRQMPFFQRNKITFMLYFLTIMLTEMDPFSLAKIKQKQTHIDI